MVGPVGNIPTLIAGARGMTKLHCQVRVKRGGEEGNSPVCHQTREMGGEGEDACFLAVGTRCRTQKQLYSSLPPWDRQD